MVVKVKMSYSNNKEFRIIVEVIALGLYCTSQFCFLIYRHQGDHQTKRAIIDEILKETVINYREYACGALCGLMFWINVS